MTNITRIARTVVTTGVATLVLTAGSVAAFAKSTPKAVYNSADAAMVPSVYKNVTLQVATDATYAPDEFVQNGAIVGFDVDLINGIATTLGIKVHTNSATFDNIIPGLQSKRYAIGNSSFTDNLSREKQVNFVDYFQAGEGVYKKATSSLHFSGFSSFCGHSVAVESGTVEETDAKAVKCSGGAKVNVLSFKDQTQANTAVSSGHADFGFLDSQIAGYVAATSHGLFKTVGQAVNVAPYGIATQKNPNGKNLAMAMQMALKTMIANGSYAAILAKWGVSSGALSASHIVLNGAKS